MASAGRGRAAAIVSRPIKTLSRGAALSSILVTAGAIALMLLVYFVVGEEVEQWLSLALRQQRTIALLVVAALALDTFLPVPSSLVSLAAGASLGLAGGFLAIFSGMSIGSALSYGVGRGLRAPTRAAAAAYAGRRVDRRALIFLLVCRPVPLLSETSAILMGFWNVPFPVYAAVSTIANAAVALTFAWCGASAASAGSAWLVVPVLLALGVAWLLIARSRGRFGTWVERGRAVRDDGRN